MAQRQEGSAEEGEEHRMRAALRHLQAEAGVLERLVYKHRNQHRGAAYFQYLLKVRRDLKLLLGANLAEVINAVFPVITCRKPANTILVPNRQGKRKPGANHSHYMRLLGVARLLSQTGKSKHYGFIEFDSPAVAKIVADEMNNYLLFEHTLQVALVPPEKVHPKLPRRSKINAKVKALQSLIANSNKVPIKSITATQDENASMKW